MFDYCYHVGLDIGGRWVDCALDYPAAYNVAMFTIYLDLMYPEVS